MNLTVISLAFLRRRRLSGLLSVCLLGFGLGTIDAVLLFSHQLRDGLERNIGGIDLVVGAKGSPLQLILSSIFHADTPTGNIPLDEARKIASRRGIHQAIPVALGDSYESHRIVGTKGATPTSTTRVSQRDAGGPRHSKL
jgi:putative ABC transport system permease protein